MGQYLSTAPLNRTLSQTPNAHRHVDLLVRPQSLLFKAEALDLSRGRDN
jgi:hypothetical protein